MKIPASRGRLVLITAGLLFAGLLLWAWQPDRDPALVEARWATPPSQFVEVDGMRVHLRDEGAGLPILLIHGTSSSLHTWDGWAAALTAEARVVRADLPGFGLTGPRDDSDYRIDAYVAFVEALARKLDLGCMVVGGNSLGGLIAWRYALAHPEHTAGLMLLNAAGLPRDDVPLLIRLGQWPVVGDILPRLTPRPVVEDQIRRVYGDPSRITPEVRDRYWELLLRAGNREAYKRYTRTARFSEHHEQLGEITAPTLILWGELDQLIPVTHAREFARRIPGSRYLIWPGVGHVPMEEIPDESAAVARAWLAEQRLCPTTAPKPEPHGD